jgi:hypothetical protein
MWRRKPRNESSVGTGAGATPLRAAMHQARVEAAERTSVVVELRDAELARLELLNEALDPLFKEIPETVDLFDRGISKGETPRLWIDAVTHVAMGRDKRLYRFLNDTRMGRRVLAESHDIPVIVEAVTAYVARRLVERERALADQPEAKDHAAPHGTLRAFGALVFGFVLGVAALLIAALVTAR